MIREVRDNLVKSVNVMKQPSNQVRVSQVKSVNVMNQVSTKSKSSQIIYKYKYKFTASQSSDKY